MFSGKHAHLGVPRLTRIYTWLVAFLWYFLLSQLLPWRHMLS